MKRIFATAIVGAILAGPVAAKPPLGQQPSIRDGMIEVAIAYELSRVCPQLDARLIRGVARLNSLRSEALRLGYTRAEVDAFMDDGAQKDQLEALARARLRDLGGVPGDVDSHCRVGAAEIAAGSGIGRLLR